MALDAATVARYALGAGLTPDRAVVAVAIAHAESGFDPGAVGDTRLANATWGPSVGLWQIRSLNRDRGTGRTRDADRLTDPTFNASAMASISGGGVNWSPWSVYTSGAYRQYLAGARAAVTGASSAGATGSGSGAGAVQAGAAGGLHLPSLDLTPDWLDSLGRLLSRLADPAWWRRVGVGALGALVALVGAVVVLHDVSPGAALGGVTEALGAA